MEQPTVHPAFSYEVVRLASGTASVRSLAEGETFHPVIGPVAEAEALYVRQLRLPERAAAAAASGCDFIIWDVGLGSAANVTTALRHLAKIPGRVKIVSFDHTLEALRFARAHAADLVYPLGFEEPEADLLQHGRTRFRHGELDVDWEVHVADFPTLIAGKTPLPAPDVVFFDAYSPARNPAMWTLPLFRRLHERLDPARPASMATYSRATLLRATLLCAGFYVGAGHATGEKEETTVAANNPSLIEEPLTETWLVRARRSTSAEPLGDAIYRQAPLKPETLRQIESHPQFRTGSTL